jgi:hypothetical protein
MNNVELEAIRRLFFLLQIFNQQGMKNEIR